MIRERKAARPNLKPASFDGSSSWEDYKAQFYLIAEPNGWDLGTKAIKLAASLQGPARAVIGDLDVQQRRDLAALMSALDSRFGSKHQTELYQQTKPSRRGEARRDETVVNDEMRQL